MHHWLTPLFEGWGLPAVAADVAGFVLALLVVTFIHLVVGEMAPKSWAIAHPERSATLLAVPMRAFMVLFRPLLRALNAAANWLVRKVGVEPANEVAVGHSPDALRHLVEHSANVGALDARFSAQFSGALELEQLTVRELLRPGARVTGVPAAASVADVRAATRRSGHLRILLGVGDGEKITGVVHVRDTLTAPESAPAAQLARPVFTLEADPTVHAALKAMRETATTSPSSPTTAPRSASSPWPTCCDACSPRRPPLPPDRTSITPRIAVPHTGTDGFHQQKEVL